MKRTAIATAFSLIAGAASTPALAGTITETFNVSLGGFTDLIGSTTPPITSVTASFTISYDPSLTYDNDTTDLVVNQLTGFNQFGTTGPAAYTLGSKLGFTYSGNLLTFGGIQNDAASISFHTTDIAVQFNVTNPAVPTFELCTGYCGNASNSNDVALAAYTLADVTAGYFASASQSSVTVPEPSAPTLLVVGLIALAVVHRPGQKTTVKVH